MKIQLLLLIHFSMLVSVHCSSGNEYDMLDRFLKLKRLKRLEMDHASNKDITDEYSYSPVYVGPQDGLKDADKISELPGQPDGTDFDQYSGYVTVDPDHGKALFYYLTESPINSSTNPLLLWLNGGPGCSSMAGAMTELGPFKVNADERTLSRNIYAWNNVSNILFLESPPGVGFSYSNTSSDYVTGDAKTAKDSFTFLVNWLERFPEYKPRDFYIAGQSYAGHYIPQLSKLILQNNENGNQTRINLKGIAMGNAYVDGETQYIAKYDYLQAHAIISDEIHKGIFSNCIQEAYHASLCEYYLKQVEAAKSNIFIYDIYAPLCVPGKNGTPPARFDPCSGNYMNRYLNTPAVQKSLHVKEMVWKSCSDLLDWKDMPLTVLPVIKDLLASGISVWFYSGDTDARIPVTSTRYAIKKLKPSVKTQWYPWMYQDEVGGYAVGYESNQLVFVTIRGAGHSVPSYQPGRAHAFITSFLKGELP
ncbi:peptidase S10, serine carboxypeptidase, Alpha/Beta hydrolase fold protein [Artemisia annua]|uniref:Peptidase S10, serine carboxypeptidase, Alpha/Beta hydrolase fold protein n=1 Tax=Artemisia annua TaxID=35608 RepID=A0A2U1MLM2_ARTAN|nr:peptidase S10, serine carboxypeptidase, Alpha/Beta hydrolase fold protein [Artemisia annua]